MRKRIKLADRLLPNYSVGEEVMNTVTHIVGGALGIVVLISCVVRSILNNNPYGLVGPLFMVSA
jgi:hemolysin III